MISGFIGQEWPRREKESMHKRKEHEDMDFGNFSMGEHVNFTHTHGCRQLEVARVDWCIRADQRNPTDVHAHLARTRGSQKQSARTHARRAHVESCT